MGYVAGDIDNNLHQHYIKLFPELLGLICNYSEASFRVSV